MQEPRFQARLETSRGELVCHVPVVSQVAPHYIVLGQRVFHLEFCGEAASIYREKDGVYVAG